MIGQQSDNARSKPLKALALQRNENVLQNLYSAVRSRPAPPTKGSTQATWSREISVSPRNNQSTKMVRDAVSANARKSWSRVSSGIPASRQLRAMSASPSRALRRFARTFARSSPARFQNPGWTSISSSSERVFDASGVMRGSLSNSVKTGGAMSSCRSARLQSSSSTSLPPSP